MGDVARVTYYTTNLGVDDFLTIDLYKGVSKSETLTTVALGGDTYKDVTIPAAGLDEDDDYAFHVFKTGDTSVNRTSGEFEITEPGGG